MAHGYYDDDHYDGGWGGCWVFLWIIGILLFIGGLVAIGYGLYVPSTTWFWVGIGVTVGLIIIGFIIFACAWGAGGHDGYDYAHGEHWGPPQAIVLTPDSPYRHELEEMTGPPRYMYAPGHHHHYNAPPASAPTMMDKGEGDSYYSTYRNARGEQGFSYGGGRGDGYSYCKSK